MNGFATHALAASLTLLSFFPAQAAQRVWTSSDGRELNAEFVSADADAVTVRRANFRTHVIPLTLLSEADRNFVSQQVQKLADEKAAAAALEEAAKKPLGSVTYKLSGGSENWPDERKNAIVSAMDAAVDFYNKHAPFKKELTANNSPGTPTADANISGWINWGGTINRRVALHEISHTLGIGTHENWQKNIENGLWTGKLALAQLREFDGEDAVLHADRQHFWPYGLNQDSESSKVNDLRHVKMVEAMRKDMGMR
ncbi:MAG: hypothetical protein V4640_02575 [Verrucomicrobiota bacterium]